MNQKQSIAGSPAVLLALYNAMRSIQLYPLENEAVRRAVADVEATAGQLFETEGGISIWVAGNYLFLNDLQVKLELAD